MKNQEKRIVGGNETNPYSMPWNVALLNEDSSLLCGGVLISSKHIITAAHCTISLGWEMPLTVVVGEHNLQNHTDGTTHSVAIVIRHPDYNMDLFGVPHNDIAIVTLEKHVQLGIYIQTIIACTYQCNKIHID